MASDTHSSQRWEKGALLVGFVSLAAAILVAHGSPPEAYELSIYAGTPPAFWLGTAAALLVAVFVGLRATGTPRRLALVLGGVGMLAVASLPVLRSYYFFGAGDSLTHLGWAKDIASGELPVVQLLYPGTHSIAIMLADATGMKLPRAMLVMVMAFTATFLLFLPLTTWAITRDRRATALAALSGLLFMPVNNISVFDMPHPTTQAIMFLPLVLYLAARYLTRADRDEQPVGTPTGAVLAVASTAVVLVHPQQAANVLVVFAAIVGLQLVARFVGGEATNHRTFALQAVFLAGVFAVWTPRHERASGASSALLSMLSSGLQLGTDTTQAAGSVASVGGSIQILFLKLFSVSVVFCALAGLLVLGGFLGRVEESNLTAFSRYFGLALIPLFGLFTAYFIVSYEKLHFRQLGFIMVLVTILGAVALARGLDLLSTRTSLSSGSARTLVGVAFVVMLAASVPTLYQSPYMYQSSSHVSEAQMTGYENAIEYRGSSPFLGVRGTGERWTDAILGYEESRSRTLGAGSLYASETHPATGENFTGRYVARHYDDRYLAFTDRERQQEVRVFNELRFDRSGFRSLDGAPGLNRVQANGGFQMYQINETS
ncbi:hypothetical protein M0R88_18135 [Halorussus gelatinilyticus]|uniref:Uncharacterized protein n=1 Tax=Halorussus gelatinilyticus TaxID=2937524 RepID=A0A8U0IH39_9EURY|nr:hypothetical protein [Halorussus gelatinilyticus]UPW00410.1 hypothetical protein M0R88_18135 [Halorussus gelatinilyticus]